MPLFWHFEKVKKTTREIFPGKKNPIILRNSAKNRTEISTTKKFGKFLDFPNKKRVQSRRGKFLFFAFLSGFFTIFLGAIAGAISVKNDAEFLFLTAKKNAEMAIFSAKNHDFEKMKSQISAANSAISRMKNELSPLFLNTNFIQNSKTAAAQKIIDLAEEIFSLAEKSTAKMDDFSQIFAALTAGDAKPALDFLKHFRADFENLSKKIVQINADLAALDSPILPKNFREKIARLSEFSAEFSRGGKILSELLPAAAFLLGDPNPTTTAIFFENSGEIRATGGFPGSMAMILADDGKLRFTFRDIYFFAWKNGAFLPPPRGFERLARRLTLRDANAFFDFPKSAAQMRKMLEISGGPTAETIVVVSDRLLVEILRAIGPLKIPRADLFLRAENAPFLLSFLVEAKLSPSENPKSFLAEILPEIREKVLKLPPEKLFPLFQKAISQKMILANSNKKIVQKMFEDFGIDGRVKNPKTADFLAVVSANVGGNKSDHFLRESLEIRSAINLSGNVKDHLTISRTHFWGKKDDELFEKMWAKFPSKKVPKTILKNILGAGENHSFTEVFVPRGAKLLDARGVPLEKIAVFEESGKTVFAFRFPKVSAGKTEKVELFYQLPKKVLNTKFDLYFQFQPGRKKIFIRREIFAESGLKITGKKVEKIARTDETFFAAIEK